jgi:hypothetical protein
MLPHTFKSANNQFFKLYYHIMNSEIKNMIDNQPYLRYDSKDTRDRLLTVGSLMMGVVDGDDLPMCTPT